MRRYKRLWARQRRKNDPEYRERERRRSRGWKAGLPAPVRRRKQRIYKRRFFGKPGARERVRREERRRYRKTCFYCGKFRKKRMQVIERLIEVSGGKFEARRIVWCGRC